MKLKSLFTGMLISACVTVSAVHASVITGNDSTQPRGSATGLTSDSGNSLDPIDEGFRAPAKNYNWAFHEKRYDQIYSTMMGWAGRDPAFFAELASSNKDLIEYINSVPGEPDNAATPLGQLLTDLELFGDISRNPGTSRLEPEELLPVAADICLRCHFPVGWLEGHSEPATTASPHLTGQFWGANFLEEPAISAVSPIDVTLESEAEAEGIQCDFCHRMYDNEKRASLFDASEMPKGNGSFFLHLTDIFGPGDIQAERTKPLDADKPFQQSAEFCGTCHDVTNPLISTATSIGGSVPDMLHPIERTYTEWYHSGFNNGDPGDSCQGCHTPMKFPGAQTWLLHPGMKELWGDVDQKWIDRGYLTPPNRNTETGRGKLRNQNFMQSAADLTVTPSTAVVNPGDTFTLDVRVTNLTGHKLPTGFAEGREMWIYVKVEDNLGGIVYEDGAIAPTGKLTRTGDTKVYERVGYALGYADSVVDSTKPADRKFRFVLENTVAQDNRIPPAGFDKAAYQADGAFIVPEALYDAGENWDDTTYTITVPADAPLGDLTYTVELRYRTFGQEYMRFLKDHGNEPTIENGGRARNLPNTAFVTNNGLTNWGDTIFTMWYKLGGRTSYVLMNSDVQTMSVE